MNYKFFFILLSVLFIYGCETTNNDMLKTEKFDVVQRYKNLGFTLIFDGNLDNIKKLDERSLDIYHKSLKKRSIVKITNPNNGKYLIARVKSNRVKFSNFYNSVISKRIAEILELNQDDLYI